jgi:hypothetical protein
VPLLPTGGGWLAVTAPQLSMPLQMPAAAVAARSLSAPAPRLVPAAAIPGPNRPDTVRR